MYYLQRSRDHIVWLKMPCNYYSSATNQTFWPIYGLGAGYLLKSNIYNHRNAIGTNQLCLGDRCSRANMTQATPLAANIRYLLGHCQFGKEDTKVERVDHAQRRSGRRRSPRLRPLLCRRRSKVTVTVILDFEGDWG